MKTTGRLITRHISVAAVTGGDSVQAFIIPETGVLESILWNFNMSVSGAAAVYGYAVLTRTGRTAQLYGAAFNGVTEDAISAITLGDSDTGALTNSYFLSACLFDRIEMQVQKQEVYQVVLNSSNAQATCYVELFVRIRV